MKLRVWHIPQVGAVGPFQIPVRSIDEAKLLISTLWDYDLFQYHNRIKPDYANATGLEFFNEDEGEWEEWYSPETGEDLCEILREEAEQGEWHSPKRDEKGFLVES